MNQKIIPIETVAPHKKVKTAKRLQREEITRDNAVSELQILLVGHSF
ncbi:9277_t:CDS:2 [Funneliformis geosporum]|uniref:9277_t:CDS:1 n=1 Tax=Funneliformis geosporum TaxID=1117311 RepID=A0A9W4SWZ8_9GLOM|nr:9277_t:CDS:2 [Funneliformis geosporum]